MHDRSKQTDDFEVLGNELLQGNSFATWYRIQAWSDLHVGVTLQ